MYFLFLSHFLFREMRIEIEFQFDVHWWSLSLNCDACEWDRMCIIVENRSKKKNNIISFRPDSTVQQHIFIYYILLYISGSITNTLIKTCIRTKHSLIVSFYGNFIYRLVLVWCKHSFGSRKSKKVDVFVAFFWRTKFISLQ